MCFYRYNKTIQYDYISAVEAAAVHPTVIQPSVDHPTVQSELQPSVDHPTVQSEIQNMEADDLDPEVNFSS